MRALLQRVTSGRVRDKSSGETLGEIGVGVVALLGVAASDTPRDAETLANKVASLRIFDDADGKMNLDCRDVDGEFLVVSQFTLYADCRHGRRPSFTTAAPGHHANTLYELFITQLRHSGYRVSTGRFQTEMLVEIVNDGPVTLWVTTDSENAS